MTWVLFWDVDGTLLTTLRAGVVALEDACLSVTGRPLDLDAIETAGLPDTEIAARILAQAGYSIDEASVRRLLAVYERQLPVRLPLRKGRVLSGVQPILERLRERHDVLSLLLTGNTPAGAAAKLRHFGLEEYFDKGAFAEIGRSRLEIAQAALSLAREIVGEVPPDRRIVIGDTPHDIACGGAIQARTVALATGIYSTADLAAHSPTHLWEALPEPKEFEETLGLSASA